MGAHAATPPALLVVEHEWDLQALVVAALVEAGYRVTAVGSIEAACAALTQERFGLVLTDGFSRLRDPTLASIAALLQAADATPVVLVTAHRFADVELRAAGVRGVIEKPFDVDHLVVRVGAVLQASS